MDLVVYERSDFIQSFNGHWWIPAYFLIIGYSAVSLGKYEMYFFFFTLVYSGFLYNKIAKPEACIVIYGVFYSLII